MNNTSIDNSCQIQLILHEGKYIDNFYLPLFRILTKERFSYYAPMGIYGDRLFLIEVGEGGLISVVKYEIIEK